MSSPITPRREVAQRHRVSWRGIVRAEIIKMRSLTPSIVLLGITFGLMVAAALSYSFLLGSLAGLGPQSCVREENLATFGSTGATTTMVLSAIFGAYCVCADDRHGVTAASFLACASRRSLVTAKVAVASVIVAVVTFFGALVEILLGGLICGVIYDLPYPWDVTDLWFALLGVPLASALACLIGVGVALFFRSLLAATLTVVGVWYLLPIVVMFALGLLTRIDGTSFLEKSYNLLPNFALGLLVTSPTLAARDVADTFVHSWWIAFIVALVWTLLLLGVGMWLFGRRPLRAR